MARVINDIVKNIFCKLDIFLSLFVYPAAFLLYMVRRFGVDRLFFCRNVLLKVGVFPIRHHYYEPLFRTDKLKLNRTRVIEGVNFRPEEQLLILNKLIYEAELDSIETIMYGQRKFKLDNGAFCSGDAEFWYQMIRYLKPARIIEIGSGFSSLLAMSAVERNQCEDEEYSCKHVCIEPYEHKWLEKTPVVVIREKVEDINIHLFQKLGENDILFIDSSHIIRPQGDVLALYLNILPCLKKGVVVHVHDIFTPRDYLKEWLQDKMYFWNEQYILEALLQDNPKWKIIGALNYLHHKYSDNLNRVCPYLSMDREPGSFYIQKVM